MDGPKTTLQERIKALNKTGHLSPATQQTRRNYEFTKPSVAAGNQDQSNPAFPHMLTKRRRSIENIYSEPTKTTSANGSERTHLYGSKVTRSTQVDDMELNDVGQGSDFSIYAVPNNKPLTPPPDRQTNSPTRRQTSEDDVYMIPKTENVTTLPDRQTTNKSSIRFSEWSNDLGQLSCEDNGVYMTPRRESAPIFATTQVNVLPPTRENSMAKKLEKTQSLDVDIELDINSRWRTLRKTVKDPNLREMVDMSNLATPPSSTTTNTFSHFRRISDATREEEVPTTPPKLSPKKNIASFPKQSFIPETEKNSNVEEDNSAETTSDKNLNFGLSRQSSEKSTSSIESQRSRGISDTSSISVEIGRSRNVLDVAPMEGNYISFGCHSDVNNDDIERTLVTVKDGVAHSEKLVLETQRPPSPNKEKTSGRISPGQLSNISGPRSPVKVQERSHLWGQKSQEDPLFDGKKGKKKGLRALDKLKKVKSKIISSGSPNTSPLATATSKTLPHRRRTPPNSPTAKPALMNVLRKQRAPSDNQPSVPRPLSIFHCAPGQEANAKSAVWQQPPSPTATTLRMSTSSSSFPEEENIYYDPSKHDIKEESDKNQSNDDDDDFEQWDYKQSTTRSRSLANLAEDLETSGLFRKHSEEVFTTMEEPLYVCPTPPIPPPKTKSIRKKAERRLAQTLSVTSPEPMTSPETTITSPEETTKLRKPKFKFDDHKVNWPGGRPPSMPIQMPPQPPQVPGAGATEQEEREKKQIQEETQEDIYVTSNITSLAKEAPSFQEPANSGEHKDKTETQPPTTTEKHRLPPLLPRSPLSQNTTDGIRKTNLLAKSPVVPKPTMFKKSFENNPIDVNIAPIPPREPLMSTQLRTIPQRPAPPSPSNIDKETPEPDKPQQAQPPPRPFKPSKFRLKNGINETYKPTAPTKPNESKFTPQTESFPIKSALSPRSERKFNFTGANLPNQRVPSPLNFSHRTESVSPHSPSSPSLPHNRPQNDSPDGAVTQDSNTVSELQKVLASRIPLSPKPEQPQKPEISKAPFQPPVPKSPFQATTSKPPSMSLKSNQPQTLKSPLRMPTTFPKVPPSIPPPKPTMTSEDRQPNATKPSVARPNRPPTISKQGSVSIDDTQQSSPIRKTIIRKTPTRPTAPPPPRPDAVKKSESVDKGEKIPPPRPPPPSSAKIQRVLNRQISMKDDDDYNDHDLKNNGGANYNHYAAIEDLEPDKEEMQTRYIIKPVPPARNKAAKKKLGPTLSMLTNMKTKLVSKQKRSNSDTSAISNISNKQPMSLESDTYKEIPEEAVYAGIDDADYPTTMTQQRPVMTPYDFAKNIATKNNDSSDDKFDSDENEYGKV